MIFVELRTNVMVFGEVGSPYILAGAQTVFSCRSVCWGTVVSGGHLCKHTVLIQTLSGLILIDDYFIEVRLGGSSRATAQMHMCAYPHFSSSSVRLPPRVTLFVIQHTPVAHFLLCQTLTIVLP